jgi:hypothetical protein
MSDTSISWRYTDFYGKRFTTRKCKRESIFSSNKRRLKVDI